MPVRQDPCMGLLSPAGALVQCNEAMAQICGPTTGAFWESACWRSPDNRIRVRQCIETARQRHPGRLRARGRGCRRPDRDPRLEDRPSLDAGRKEHPAFGRGLRCDLLRQAERERATLQAQMIEAQEATIRELSTPLIPVDAGIVVVPLIGRLDKGRATELLKSCSRVVSSARHQRHPGRHR